MARGQPKSTSFSRTKSKSVVKKKKGAGKKKVVKKKEEAPPVDCTGFISKLEDFEN